jgi:hypothetical protein
MVAVFVGELAKTGPVAPDWADKFNLGQQQLKDFGNALGEF